MYLTEYITHLVRQVSPKSKDRFSCGSYHPRENVFGFTYVLSSMSAQEGKSSEEGQVIQNVLEKIKKGKEQLQSLFSKCEMKN